MKAKIHILPSHCIRDFCILYFVPNCSFCEKVESGLLVTRETKPSLAAQCSLVETDMISSWRNIPVYPIIGKYTLCWRLINYILNFKLLRNPDWHDFSSALLMFWFGEWDGLIYINQKFFFFIKHLYCHFHTLFEVQNWKYLL